MGEELLVNGKYYPLWSQFVERKDEWIGGVLQDFGDSIDTKLGLAKEGGVSTVIIDVTLEPSGEDSAFFSFEGEDFSCGFSVKHGGVVGGEEGWITFSGGGGHKWRVKQSEETCEEQTSWVAHDRSMSEDLANALERDGLHEMAEKMRQKHGV